MSQFENLYFQYIINMEYLNELNARARQIFYQEGILFNPQLSQKYSFWQKFDCIIQRCGTLVIVARGAYHGGFNNEYNISSVVND